MVVRALIDNADRWRLAEVSGAFYVCIYLGLALPVIGIGVLAVLTTLFIAVTTFACVTGSAAIAVAVWHLVPHEGRPEHEHLVLAAESSVHSGQLR